MYFDHADSCAFWLSPTLVSGSDAGVLSCGFYLATETESRVSLAPAQCGRQ